MYKKIKMKDKSEKGSLTLEAAIVIPIVTAGLILMIYMCIFMYSRIATSIVVNRTLNTISNEWFQTSGQFAVRSEKGSIVQKMYWPVDISEQEKKIEDYIVAEVEKNIPMKVDLTPKADGSNFIITQSISVKITAEYNIPFKGVLKLIGVDSEIKDDYTKNICIFNTNFNMRTLRYVQNLAKRLGVDELITDFKDKIKQVFSFMGGD